VWYYCKCAYAQTLGYAPNNSTHLSWLTLERAAMLVANVRLLQYMFQMISHIWGWRMIG